MAVTKKHIGQWRSIEFECWFIDKKAKDEFKKFAKKYGKQVEIGQDWSIEPSENIEPCGVCGGCEYDGYCDRHYKKGNAIPAEIRVSYVSGKEKIVRDICAFLKKRAKVNETCGTHFHFDMRHLSNAEMKVYATRLACAVPALKKLLPYQRRNSEYFEYGDVGGLDWEDDKYFFINAGSYHKYKTIEVRGHAGTLDADKILNWIALCERIMYSDITKEVKTIKDLRKTHKLGKSLDKYVANRAKEVSNHSFVET